MWPLNYCMSISQHINPISIIITPLIYITDLWFDLPFSLFPCLPNEAFDIGFHSCEAPWTETKWLPINLFIGPLTTVLVECYWIWCDNCWLNPQGPHFYSTPFFVPCNMAINLISIYGWNIISTAKVTLL